MPKFKTQPVVVEAVEYTGTLTNELIAWLGGEAQRNITWSQRESGQLRLHVGGVVLRADRGDDWIIKGANGKLWVLDSKAFKALYPPVEELKKA